jgi:VanZ family protein
LNRLYNIFLKNKVRLIYFPLALYWITLFIATSIPSEALPKIAVGDKLEHFFAYMILSILVSLTFHFQKKIKLLNTYPLLSALFVVSLYGALDEWHQTFIPGRYAELLDMVSNFFGALFGIIVTYFLVIRHSKGKKNNLYGNNRL